MGPVMFFYQICFSSISVIGWLRSYTSANIYGQGFGLFFYIVVFFNYLFCFVYYHLFIIYHLLYHLLIICYRLSSVCCFPCICCTPFTICRSFIFYHPLQLDQIDRIIFCLFLDIDVRLYESWMQVYFPCSPPSARDTPPVPSGEWLLLDPCFDIRLPAV